MAISTRAETIEMCQILVYSKGGAQMGTRWVTVSDWAIRKDSPSPMACHLLDRIPVPTGPPKDEDSGPGSMQAGCSFWKVLREWGAVV